MWSLSNNWYSHKKSSFPRRRRLLIIETFHKPAFYLFTQDAFDAAHGFPILPCNKGKGISCLCSTSGSADPVRIGIYSVRDIEVDNMRYVRDIYAPSSNVSGNEYLVFAVTETVECRLPLILRQIPL